MDIVQRGGGGGVPTLIQTRPRQSVPNSWCKILRINRENGIILKEKVEEEKTGEKTEEKKQEEENHHAVRKVYHGVRKVYHGFRKV